jgi:hypothetical protein
MACTALMRADNWLYLHLCPLESCDEPLLQICAIAASKARIEHRGQK